MTLNTRIVILLAAAMGLTVATADAQTIDDATSGLSSPATTVTFDNDGTLTDRGSVSTQFADQGVTFGHRRGWLNNDPWNHGTPGILRNNEYANSAYDDMPLAMFFDGPVRGAAFRFRTNSGTSVFEAFLGGTLVHSFTAATYAGPSATAQWYGFDESITLDEIRLEAPGNDAFNLDNLEIGAAADVVPEPGTVVLLGTGLLGMMGLAVRRRNDEGSV